MKRILFLSMLALAACSYEPEIKPSPPYGANGSMLPCYYDYKWHHTTNPLVYSSTPFGHYRSYSVNLMPQWFEDGSTVPAGHTFRAIDNVQFKLLMKNTSPTGHSTMRVRIDGGAWETLAPGQSSTLWFRTAWGSVNCPVTPGYAPMVYTVDVERLTCGTGYPYHWNYEMRTISVSNGHNYGLPGYVPNSIQFGLISQGTTCTI